jgi:hypothetical protein
MKRIRFLSTLFIISAFSMMITNSCEIFTPSYEEFELYGTWNIDDISVDVDISGDNKVQVLAAKLLIAVFKDELNEEMEHQIDSLGGTITFNPDLSFYIALMEDQDTGSWYFNEEENTITLAADETSLDELNIERLNKSNLILSWISEEGDFETDSTGDAFTAQVTIEAVFSKE